MSVLITNDRWEFGIDEARKVKIAPLSTDTLEAVAMIKRRILGLEQTPESLAYQIDLCTAARAKSDIALILTKALSDQPEFASQTIALVLPKVSSPPRETEPERDRPLLLPLDIFYRRFGMR